MSSNGSKDLNKAGSEFSKAFSGFGHFGSAIVHAFQAPGDLAVDGARAVGHGIAKTAGDVAKGVGNKVHEVAKGYGKWDNGGYKSNHVGTIAHAGVDLVTGVVGVGGDLVKGAVNGGKAIGKAGAELVTGDHTAKAATVNSRGRSTKSTVDKYNHDNAKIEQNATQKTNTKAKTTEVEK